MSNSAYRKLSALLVVFTITVAALVPVFVNALPDPSVLVPKWTAKGLGGSDSGVLIYDVNNDSKEEVIYAGVGKITVMNGTNGKVIWQKTDSGIADMVKIQAADLNKDGILEIVIPLKQPAGLLVLRANDGSLYWKRFGLGKAIWGSAVIGDIDGNGYATIFTATMGDEVDELNSDSWLTAMDYTGKTIARTWIWHPCAGGLSLADADNDGVFEIYMGERNAGYNGYPYGKGVQSYWAKNLTLRWYDPTVLCSSHAPLLADVNNDGILEVVIGGHSMGIIAVYDSRDGHVIRKLSGRTDLAPIHYAPSIYDIDGDTHLEILMADGEHGSAGNDNVIWDLVDWKEDGRFNVGPCWYGPTVADLDGDGKMEIIAANMGGKMFVYKYDSGIKSYVQIANVTIGGSTQILTYAVVQDIDGDGLVELVITSMGGGVYAFDTLAPRPSTRVRTEVQHYSERRLCAAEYVPPPGGLAPVISSPDPANGTTDVPLSLSQLSFNLTDFQQDMISYTVTTSPNIGSGGQTGKGNGRYSIPINNLNFATTYSWAVTATDGIHSNSKTFTFTTQPMPPWWNTLWQYRRTITIDHTKVNSDQTDYPVLIDLTDAGLTTEAQTNGNDFVFTDINQAKLSHEIESYDSATGHLIVWIRVPALSSTANTLLYMYYGNSLSGNQQTKNAVWDSSNRMVLHLAETFGTQYDSTINGNNAAPTNGVVQGTAGRIDGSDTFDGTNDYMQIPHSNSLTGFSQGFTAGFWLRLGDVSRRQTILNKYNSAAGQRSWYVEYQTNRLGFFASQDGTNYGEWHATFIPTAGTWYFITITWEPNAVPKFYVNGMQVATSGTAKIASIYNNVGVPLYVGRCPYDSTRYLKGSLDEIRISNPARSAGWILTSYRNQQNPSAFYQVGGEESLPKEPIISDVQPVDGAANVPISLNQLDFNLIDYQHDLMTYYVTTTPNVGGSITSGVADGEYSVSITGLEYSTMYTWQLNVTDGTHWTNRTYTFTTESKLVQLLVDSQFDASSDSAGLRANGSGQDWYESRGAFPGGDSSLLFLDTSNVGGDSSKKAGFTASESANAYLTQEFSSAQTGVFTAQWDIYVDSILAGSGGSNYQAGIMMIGIDSGSSPNRQGGDRFVYMVFSKPGGGTSGPMDLVASGTTVAPNLNLDQWYTIKVIVNVAAGTYDVYVNGVFKATVSANAALASVDYISLAQWDDGAGAFYVDNVYAFIEAPGNQAPIIDSYYPLNNPTIYEGKTQEFNVTYHDPESDATTVHWYLNGTPTTTTDSYKFTSVSGSAGTYVVNVTIADKYGANISRVWTLNVLSIPPPILVDSSFDNSIDSADLRSNSLGQDWYESRNDVPTLLYLDETNVSGNVGKKAGFTASSSGNAYLSQEFSSSQTDMFIVQWDIYVDSILPGAPYAGIMMIGRDGGSGPNQGGANRFVYMAFSSGGTIGTMNLIAISPSATIAANLNLKQWYTIKVVVNVPAGTYDVYVDGVFEASVSANAALTSLTHISFAQWNDGAGAFYVDNVYSPAA